MVAPVLPWVVREKLRLELRPIVQGKVDADELGAVVASTIEESAKGPGGTALRAALKTGLGRRRLPKLARSWAAELPATHRSDWLVDRLATDAGFVWGSDPGASVGIIRIPLKERERIARRFAKLEEDLLDRHDDDAEADEYIGVLEEELERIATKHPDLAHRITTKRFPGTSHPPTSLTLRGLLEAEQIADPEELLRFVTERLDLEWVDG